MRPVVIRTVSEKSNNLICKKTGKLINEIPLPVKLESRDIIAIGNETSILVDNNHQIYDEVAMYSSCIQGPVYTGRLYGPIYTGLFLRA